MKVCKVCGEEFTRQDSLTRHINTVCEPPENWTRCPECHNHYKEIGNHYHFNNSHRPDITDKQKEIILGVLLGDGCVSKPSSGPPRFVVDMVSENYINYLKEKLQPFSKEIYQPPTVKDNHQQQYELRTIVHPALSEYRDWYSTGEKVYPENIEITPTVLKNWYVTDGHLTNKYEYPSIRCWNERNNTEKVLSYFEDIPLTTTFSSGTIRFPGEKRNFFDYIGEPLPDFEYKWPNERY